MKKVSLPTGLYAEYRLKLGLQLKIKNIFFLSNFNDFDFVLISTTMSDVPSSPFI